ncbi:MAG: pyruvate kinase alpha/beta domain-containing protein [Candidatus Hadarchaeales archaeon]
MPEALLRRDLYLEKPGPRNTDQVVRAVVDRMRETGIRTVVVASDSGETAVRLARAAGKVKLVVISMERLKPSHKTLLEKSGAIVFEHCKPAFWKFPHLREVYYTLGQGFKVAAEVIMMAAERGAVREGEEVIGVGGTGRGADTAIVAKAARPGSATRGEVGKRFEVREIIVMPRKKKWWE